MKKITINERFKTHHDVAMSGNPTIVKESSSKDNLFEYLKMDTSNERSCIYIHVPWCDKICSFCNLLRKKLDRSLLDEYTDKVVQQAIDYGKTQYIKNSNIETVYFGGGTPTVLKEEHFTKIINAIKENFNLTDDCQISIESTLHNLPVKKIKHLESLGVNRFSIGIQTFDTEGRKFFNRTYDKETVVAKLKEFRENFSGYIAIDKIYNYKGETLETLLEDVRIIKELELDSVSFYSLMIQKGSSLSDDMTKEELSDETDLKFQQAFVEAMLDGDDYEVMEITKIARKNRDTYKYIQVRHAAGDTIPMGKNAGGNIGPFGIYLMDFSRWMVSKTLTKEITQLRKVNGMTQKHTFDLNDYTKYFSKEQLDFIVGMLDMLVEEGYYTKENDKFYMTSLGLFYGNNISNHVVACCIDKFIKGE